MATKEPQVLEPITAIARVATLAFMPEGTKIGFRNHTIVICEPGFFYKYLPFQFGQGFERYWHKDSRNDLYIFNHVIHNFMQLYVLPYKATNPEMYNNLINMARYACVGLKKLLKVYSEPTCNSGIVIQYYLNRFRDIINENYDESSYYSASSLDEDLIASSKSSISTILDMEKFKNFWSLKDLKLLCRNFNGCFNNDEIVNNVIFSERDEDIDGAFDVLIKNTEELQASVYEDEDGNETLMDALMSMPSFESDKKNRAESSESKDLILPTLHTDLSPAVKSHINAINTFLKGMDERFTRILTRSMGGN